MAAALNRFHFSPFTTLPRNDQAPFKTARLTNLVALPRPMTRAALRSTVPRFGHFAIRANAGLRVHAPEQPVVGTLHIRIRLRKNELSFPAQSGTKIGVFRIEALRLADHAAPPAAFRMARFTATRASCTL